MRYLRAMNCLVQAIWQILTMQIGWRDKIRHLQLIYVAATYCDYHGEKWIREHWERWGYEQRWRDDPANHISADMAVAQMFEVRREAAAGVNHGQ